MRLPLRLALLLLTLSTYLHAQQADFNVSLVGQLDYPLDCSDIWGYVDETGVEYAIMGVLDGTAVISLADPTNPTEVLFVPGATSIWRDMKTFGDYAYITTDEGSDGLLVIDLSPLPTGTPTFTFWNDPLTINGITDVLTHAHNLYIDEQGIAYISGANLNQGGVLLLNVDTPDGLPVLVGVGPAEYSHDSYARGDTLYSSDINVGYFSVIDVTNKANPVLLATKTTSFDFTHNAWLSDDGTTLFTTDERPNAWVDAYDISDLTDIQRIDRYRPAATVGLGVVPHNVHVLDDYLVISHYSDGLKIVDANRPTNLVEVGSYDTHTTFNGGFHGAWGAYPFLPSGRILVSDIEAGLFVLEPTYQRAAYLEGTVTDAATGLPLTGAAISIVDPSGSFSADELSDDLGDYATGTPNTGALQVMYTQPGYADQVVTVVMLAGQVVEQNVALQPLGTLNVDAQAVRAEDLEGIATASIYLRSEDFSYEQDADASGTFGLLGVTQGIYDVYIGAWGFETQAFEGAVLDADYEPIVAQLGELRYADPFAVDLGWSVSGTAATGQWELAVPVETTFQGSTVNPAADVPDDIGPRAYITGNAMPGAGPGANDVDGGTTILTSPTFDLTDFSEPVVRYSLYFYNAGGNTTPNDYLRVELTNGAQTVLLEEVTQSGSDWRPESSIDLTGLLDFNNQMQLIFTTEDVNDGHLVEAGVDNVLILDSDTTTVSLLPTAGQSIYLMASPNPVEELLTIDYRLAQPDPTARLQVYDLAGRMLYQENLPQLEGQVRLPTFWVAGTYIVELRSRSGARSIKVVKR